MSTYSRETEEAKIGMTRAKVYVCTKDKLSQLLHHGTDTFFGESVEILLVRDEYQRESFEEVCLALAMASAMILLGDKNQAPDQQEQTIQAPIAIAQWLRDEKMLSFTALENHVGYSSFWMF